MLLSPPPPYEVLPPEGGAEGGLRGKKINNMFNCKDISCDASNKGSKGVLKNLSLPFGA